MLTKPFLEGILVLKEIEKNGHQAFFVGGSVRDLLLKRPIKDIDIATSASPQQIQAIFESVIPIGIEHGTVIVRYKKESYEITTFRIDGAYSDKRHPDSVEFIDTIDQDLQRRDFTINALAMDKDGVIVDLFKGAEDLKAKTIRTVGDGYERFTEDPLRIVRALRFSSQLGFAIDSQTIKDIQKTKNLIKTIAIERIANEITKLFAGTYVNNGVNYLRETKVYKELPIIREYPQIILKLPNILEPLKSFAEVLALFNHIEPSIKVTDWIHIWKCSNKTKREVRELIQAIANYKVNGLNYWLVYQLSPAYYAGFTRVTNNTFNDSSIQLKDIEAIDQALPINSRGDLKINGRDIIELFPKVKQGPWIHDILQQLEKLVVLQKLSNTTSQLKEWIKCNPPVIN